RRLLALEGVSEAAALLINRHGRQGIGALLVLTEEARKEWQQKGKKRLEFAWRSALLPWLEPVAVPRFWRVVDAIPVNCMHKRVYRQLKELFDETP
ncbi:MAG: AMP-dependent synthetase, partial [Enterobacteriaceae bacterium]